MGYKNFDFVVWSTGINEPNSAVDMEKQVNDFVSTVTVDKVVVNFYDVRFNKNNPNDMETRKSIDIFYD